MIGADEREYGPVEMPTLVQWAREGRIVARTTILDHATGRRFLACDTEELAAVFSSAALVAPPVRGKPAAAVATQPPVSAQALVVDKLKPRRSRTVAGVLGIIFGCFGVHRFYLGHTSVGTLMLAITLLSCFVASPLTALWGLIEGILCLTGAMTDAEGRKLGI
jgi:TM2 domain-containing membrane protein YozV